MNFYIITTILIIFTYLYFKYFKRKNNQIESENLLPKKTEKLEKNKKNEKIDKNLEKKKRNRSRFKRR